jgi:hypothetical protein
MSDVYIDIVVRFNSASVNALKVMLQSLLEHPDPDEAAIKRLRETIWERESLLAQGRNRLRKEIATQETLLKNGTRKT